MASRNPIGWFEIYVQDLPRAKAFYESVFATTLERLPFTGEGEMWAFPMSPDAPGASGGLIRMDGVPSGGMGTMVYFVCDDCAVEAARLVERGGTLHKAKFSIGEYGFIALGVDTEGNMLGLHSMR